MTVTARAFRIVDVAQGTPEWLAARCGLLTGSAAADVLAEVKTKGKEAADRRNLRVKLVVERLTGAPQEDGFVSHDMQRGKDLEPEAFKAYTIATGELATTYGFLAHTEYPIGFSPDGIIGDFEGLLELKCPKSATHLGYLKAATLPADYKPQVLHGMWVTGAEWCDFCSYDPRFTPDLQLFRHRVYRTPELEIEIAAYRNCALRFLEEVEDEYAAVLKLRKGAA
jgi:hypothetical protein